MNEIRIGEGECLPMDCPKNSLKIDTYLCCDVRRAECPYCVKVVIETEYLNFKQTFCAWKFKREIS